MPRRTSSYHVCYPRAMMACHTRRCRLCVLPKGKMACHARRCSTVFAVRGLFWHAPPDVVRSCVLPKGDNGMPRLTSFDRVCGIKAVMSCHA